MNVKFRGRDDGWVGTVVRALGAYRGRVLLQRSFLASDHNRVLTVPLLCILMWSGLEVEGLDQVDGSLSQ